MSALTRTLVLLAASALALLAASCGGTKQPIRIGVLADCEGYAAGYYEISLAGAELPLLHRGGRLIGAKPSDGIEGIGVGGRKLELVFGCAGGELTSGAVELRRLVESEGAQIVVGPGVVPLGIVMVDYARRQPGVTFAVTSWEVLTALDPGPNVFRFTGGFAQGEAGLGSYAYHQLGWRRAVTVTYPDAFGWGWAAGPIVEFCSLGGEIVDRVWLYDSPEKYAALFARTAAEEVDGYFLMTTGPEAGAFLKQLAKSERRLGGKVVSSAAAVTGLARAVAARLGKRLVGITSAWDIPGPTFPQFAAYRTAYGKAFPRLADAANGTFHLFDIYYRNAMDAVLQALEASGGDLSDGQRRFRAALARVKLDAPNGHIRLDANRQAIGPNYLYQVTGNKRGVLKYKLPGLKTVENVDASFGGHFGPGDPLPDRTQPRCRHGSPPAWAAASPTRASK
jgi:branched-chain amino acid transport system substrate-binding protein